MTWTNPLDGGLYYDMTAHPLAGAITLSDVKAYPWPDGRDVARVAGLAEEGRGVVEGGHAPVLVGVTAGVVEQAARVRGPADFFCDLAADPELACAIMDAVLEVKLGCWEAALTAVGDLAPGGGFVFAAVHNIQADVPPHNVEAMWEAVREYGSYGE